MPKIKAGVASSNFFNLDGLDHGMNQYQIVYNDVETSAGTPDFTRIAVGLFSKYTQQYLVQPTLFSNWTNASDTPYANVNDLLADLDTFVGFDSGGGGGSGDFVAYGANLDQTGTSAPVDTVIVNDTGLTFTWEYVSVGLYRVLLDGDHTDTTLFLLGAGGGLGLDSAIKSDLTYNMGNDETEYEIATYNAAGALADALLDDVSLKIEIYN